MVKKKSEEPKRKKMEWKGEKKKTKTSEKEKEKGKKLSDSVTMAEKHRAVMILLMFSLEFLFGTGLVAEKSQKLGTVIGIDL